MSKLPPIELSRKERTFIARELGRQRLSYEMAIKSCGTRAINPQYRESHDKHVEDMKKKLLECDRLIDLLNAKVTP